MASEKLRAEKNVCMMFNRFFHLADIAENDEHKALVLDMKQAFLEIQPVNAVEVEWIPVSERLPEKSGDYLVAVNNGAYRFTHKMYYHEGWWYDFDCEVTHWMPLPEPPKE